MDDFLLGPDCLAWWCREWLDGGEVLVEIFSVGVDLLGGGFLADLLGMVKGDGAGGAGRCCGRHGGCDVILSGLVLHHVYVRVMGGR